MTEAAEKSLLHVSTAHMVSLRRVACTNQKCVDGSKVGQRGGGKELMLGQGRGSAKCNPAVLPRRDSGWGSPGGDPC